MENANKQCMISQIKMMMVWHATTTQNGRNGKYVTDHFLVCVFCGSFFFASSAHAKAKIYTGSYDYVDFINSPNHHSIL
jgi:hypothetical protein